MSDIDQSLDDMVSCKTFCGNENNSTTLENEPGDARFVGIFIGFLVVVLGAAGNGITILAYTRNRNLQTSFNRLIANLCCVDFLSSVLVLPMFLPGYIAGKNIYSFGSCSFVGYCYYVLLASSLYNLVAIAVNRYIGIVKSRSYQKLFTRQRLAICIASVWVVPALLYIPLATGGAIKWTSNTLRCGIDGNLPPILKWYNLVLNITFQAIPLVILVVIYTAIFKKVKQVKEKMKGHHRTVKKGSKTKRTLSTGSSLTLKNKSGNTSEDTADEYKPSSILYSSGGHQQQKYSTQCKIEGGSKNTEPESEKEQYDQTDESDEEDKMRNAQLNGSTSLSNEDILSSPILKPTNFTKKRNSIIAMLMRSKRRPSIINDANFAKEMNEVVSKTCNDECTTKTMTLPKLPKVNETNTTLNDAESNDIITLKGKRKSLSAPNLKSEVSISLASQFAEKTKSASPTQYRNTPNHPQLNENVSLRTLRGRKNSENLLNRSKSTYVPQKSAENSNEILKKMPKPSMTWTVRIKRNTMNWASSLSLTGGKSKENVQTNKARLGTSARLVQDRRSKEEEKQKKRQRRNRLMRKKHARERQLAYSSFTICIAFAICIMPTSILYLIQVLSGKSTAASTTLIIGCIAWLHSVVNPMIYGYLNSQYRKEYARIVSRLTGTARRHSRQSSRHS